MRKYLPIWRKLKKDKFCEVKCAPSVQKKIRKAVQKEKDMDISFKKLTAECPQNLRTLFTQDGIYFYLEDRFNLLETVEYYYERPTD